MSMRSYRTVFRAEGRYFVQEAEMVIDGERCSIRRILGMVGSSLSLEQIEGECRELLEGYEPMEGLREEDPKSGILVACYKKRVGDEFQED